MIEILQFALTGFWRFVGCYLLFHGAAYLLLTSLMRMWSRLMRMIMVTKHGWPPGHLDADGDWNNNSN